MTPRRLTVRGRGPDGRVTFSVKVYQGKVWITASDCPFICEAILEATQADALGNLIIHTAQEARRDKNGSTS
jgi:hypothetical protein